MAEHPALFFIRMAYNFHCETVSLDNCETNEKLVIKKLYGALLISRYPMGANTKWVQANMQEMLKFVHVTRGRKIAFDKAYDMSHN
jgi:hypothetical protein